MTAIPVGEHRTIAVEKSLLEKNAVVAARNRATFRDRRLFVLNLISSPGAGKTAILERMLDTFRGRWRVGVVVADLATDNDARRLEGRGAAVLQLTTGTLCHLEADMLRRALGHFRLDELDVLAVENVGNLVCPAGYDLGEALRVVVASVPEGEDKPLKYPTAYRSGGAVVLNKTDLAAAAGFDRELALANIGRAAPEARVFEVSARTGDGLTEWHEYLERAIHNFRGA
jgi:hydrogenase nickel incorporation protein HypB